jgi:hypothetical protein
MFLPKFLGGQGFQEKLPGGVPLFWVLLHFYEQVFQKFAWGGGGVLFHPPSPPHPPVCIYGGNIKNREKYFQKLDLIFSNFLSF